MLKYLRHKDTAKKIFIALALIIIPAFVLWGTGGSGRGGSGPQYAGTMFGKKVSLQDYGQSWRAVKNEALMRYPNFNEIYEQLDMENQAWDRLMLLTEADKERIKVTDDEVINTIRSFSFLVRSGKFDVDAYERLLKNVFQVSPREYEEDIRGSLKIANLIDSVTKDIKVADDELLKKYEEENKKIKILYAAAPLKDFADKADVSEEEMEEYYKNNAQEFKIPERVNIEYVEFRYTDYLDGIEIDEEVLKQCCDFHKEEKPPHTETFEEAKEKIKSKLTAERARQNSYADALRARGAIEDGASIINTAEEYKKPLKKSGYFSRHDIVPGIGWNPALVKTAFKLKEGEVGPLISPDNVKSDANYIIRVIDKKEAGIPPISEVKEELREKVKLIQIKNLAEESMQKYGSAIKEKMAQGASFKDAAVSLGLKVDESEYIALADYIRDIGPAAALKEVFDYNIGNVSPVILSPGGALLAQLEDMEPIDKAKFEEAKEEFRKQCLEIKKAQTIDEWFAGLKAKANLASNIQ